MEIYFVLYLNPMKEACKRFVPVALAKDKNKLISWLTDQLAEEPWIDDNKVEDDYGNSHSYRKFFKKGSPLEWFNPEQRIEIYNISQQDIDDYRKDYIVLD